jgi:hypothetical protein
MKHLLKYLAKPPDEAPDAVSGQARMKNGPPKRAIHV